MLVERSEEGIRAMQIPPPIEEDLAYRPTAMAGA